MVWGRAGDGGASNPDFSCSQLLYDKGDCLAANSCDFGFSLDCSINCIPNIFQFAFIGDGVCNNGLGLTPNEAMFDDILIDYNCPKFEFEYQVKVNNKKIVRL